MARDVLGDQADHPVDRLRCGLELLGAHPRRNLQLCPANGGEDVVDAIDFLGADGLLAAAALEQLADVLEDSPASPLENDRCARGSASPPRRR